LAAGGCGGPLGSPFPFTVPWYGRLPIAGRELAEIAVFGPLDYFERQLKRV
jgi:hypothetical protein